MMKNKTFEFSEDGMTVNDLLRVARWLEIKLEDGDVSGDDIIKLNTTDWDDEYNHYYTHDDKLIAFTIINGKMHFIENKDDQIPNSDLTLNEAAVFTASNGINFFRSSHTLKLEYKNKIMEIDMDNLKALRDGEKSMEPEIINAILEYFEMDSLAELTDDWFTPEADWERL